MGQTLQTGPGTRRVARTDPSRKAVGGGGCGAPGPGLAGGQTVWDIAETWGQPDIRARSPGQRSGQSAHGQSSTQGCQAHQERTGATQQRTGLQADAGPHQEAAGSRQKSRRRGHQGAAKGHRGAVGQRVAREDRTRSWEAGGASGHGASPGTRGAWGLTPGSRHGTGANGGRGPTSGQFGRDSGL